MKSLNINVIPAKAGIHLLPLHLAMGREMGSRFRGNDEDGCGDE
jgi:hypothetical protein